MAKGNFKLKKKVLTLFVNPKDQSIFGITIPKILVKKSH